MIRHVLLVKAAVASEAAVSDVLEGLAELCGRLPGVGTVGWGPNDSPEDLERGYTHGLVADFVDGQALGAYAVHPEHVVLAGRLQAAAAGGVDGILVVDLAL